MEKVADEKLPHLDRLLNPASLRKIFDRELIAARKLGAWFRIEDCRITRVKYRPGKYCLITTQLKISNLKTTQVNHQIMTLWRGGEFESARTFDEALRLRPTRTEFGDGIFHLPELEAVGWIFPNDRKLVGLPALVRTGLSLLPGIFALGLDENWRWREVKREIIHYVAARSCTVRVNVELAHDKQDHRQNLILFGKGYCLDEGEAAWHGMKGLWESDAQQDGRLLIPEPLVYQPEIKAIWQRGLTGKNLNECAGDANYFDLLAQAGAAIATLHRMHVSESLLPEAATIGQRLIAADDLISQFQLSRQSDLKRLIDDLIAANERIGVPPKATLHGDLHLKNFFFTNDRVALIDLDNLCLGDPWQELGSFIAAIYYRCLIEGKSLEVAEQTLRPFLQAYCERVDWEVLDVTLNLRTAAALIYERVYRCLTRLTPGWSVIVDDLIGLAETLARKK